MSLDQASSVLGRAFQKPCLLIVGLVSGVVRVLVSFFKFDGYVSEKAQAAVVDQADKHEVAHTAVDRTLDDHGRHIEKLEEQSIEVKEALIEIKSDMKYIRGRVGRNGDR